MRCWNKGGSVSVIMFKTGHALPLVVTRILRPRIGRGGRAEFPHNISHSWTWQRPVHGLDSAGNRTRTGIFRVRAQSAFAFSPRQQTRSRTSPVRAQATALIVRGQAAAVAGCPQTVRTHVLSTPANWPRTQSVREVGLARHCPRRGMAVSVSSPIQFVIRVRTIAPNVLI